MARVEKVWAADCDNELDIRAENLQVATPVLNQEGSDSEMTFSVHDAYIKFIISVYPDPRTTVLSKSTLHLLISTSKFPTLNRRL